MRSKPYYLIRIKMGKPLLYAGREKHMDHYDYNWSHNLRKAMTYSTYRTARAASDEIGGAWVLPENVVRCMNVKP